MNPHISALVTYFKIELPKLEKNYQWKIPQLEGFQMNDEKGYLANVELKKYFSKKWHSSGKDKKVDLSNIIVSDWGGIKNNKTTTLQSYVTEVEKKLPSTPIKGVSSYSKIFAIVDMNKYAIYDARVAVSLNAIQWNSSIRKGVAFNYVPGRNNVTGHAGKNIGFACESRFKVRSLIKYGWSRVKRDDTYNYYINTLKQCLEYLPNYKLYDLEMVLFANAEKECKKAMKSINSACLTKQ